MPKIVPNVKQSSSNAKKYHIEVLDQMLKLTSNAFGLVAALAWNSVIQELVNNYLKPIVGADSGLISLLIYAVIVTILAVTATLQLSRLKNIVGNQKTEI
jgi:uncharacterized membrane protein (DUF106 family)